MRKVMLLTALALLAVCAAGVQAQTVFLEDFSGAAPLDNWIFYKDYAANYWEITAGQEAAAWLWGANTKCARLYEPATPLALPNAGYFEAKMRWDTGANEVAGLTVRADGEVTGTDRDNIQGLRFLIDPAAKNVLLFEDAVFVSNWGLVTSGLDGAFPSFTYDTDYIVRLNFSGHFFWGEIYDTAYNLLYTTALNKTAALDETAGGTVGLWIGVPGATGWEKKVYWDDACLEASDTWSCPDVSLSVDGYETFDCDDELADWTFYSYYRPSNDWATTLTGEVRSLNWGWGTQSAVLYEPESPLVLPANGYFETKIRFDATSVLVGGIMIRAAGEKTVLSTGDYIQSLRMGIKSTTKEVILYEDAVFTNWGVITAGIDGVFSDFSFDTDYVIRLNFSDNEFWGEIYDTANNLLYVTATKTAATLDETVGGTAGLWVAHAGAGTPGGKYVFWDEARIEETTPWICPDVNISLDGYENFDCDNELSDWLFYKDYAADEWEISASREVSGRLWGWNVKSARLYEPIDEPNIVLPTAGYFETTMRWDENAYFSAGIMVRATGAKTGADRDNQQSLRLLINPYNTEYDPNNKRATVHLYEDAVFVENWGNSNSGFDGEFVEFTHNTNYVLRLNFSGRKYWGEIYDMDGNLLYVTATQAALNIDHTAGGTVGLWLSWGDMGTGYATTRVYWDDARLVPIPATCDEVWLYGYGMAGDLTQDCLVDLNDFSILANDWLITYQMEDLIDISKDWLKDNTPEVELPDVYTIPIGMATIDGVLDEWDTANWRVMDKVYYGDAADLSNAQWAAMWSPITNLIYVAISGVDTDRTFVPQYSDWNNADMVEVYIDAANNKTIPYNDDYSDAQHYFVGADGLGGQWNALGAGNPVPTGAIQEFKAVVNGDTISYEIAITPYSYLDTAAPENSTVVTLALYQSLGLDVVMNTLHTGGFGMLCENDQTGKYGNAGAFLKCELVEE